MRSVKQGLIAAGIGMAVNIVLESMRTQRESSSPRFHLQRGATADPGLWLRI